MESAEQIQGIMARGFEQRAVGCHDVNAHSSRSHCLLVIHVAATDPTTGALVKDSQFLQVLDAGFCHVPSWLQPLLGACDILDIT